jgi:signal transduction histidine kinase
MSSRAWKMTGNLKQGRLRSIRIPGLGWRGLTLQLLFVTILPLTVLLLAITFGSIRVHQRAMRTLVGQRDERAVKTAAAALSAQVGQRMAAIQGLSQELSSEDQSSPEEILRSSEHLLRDFDGGLAVFDSDGTLLASIGDSSVWEALDSGSITNVNALFPTQPDQVRVSDAFPNPAGTGHLVAISTFVRQNGEEESTLARAAVILGTFSPSELARSTLADAFASDSQGTIMFFDASRQLLYQSGTLPSDENLQEHPGVAEALAGQSGTSFIPAEDGEHVVAYTPVVPLNWALVVEEPWEMVASPLLSYTQMAPLVLVPVLILTLFALWFGIRQIVQPLQALEEQADALAWGNYQAVETPVGGIAEIRRLQKGLIHMSQKVRVAQQSLHGYIGAITAAQEEERHRLARELHDDTIQSLIALKQRVQLAQMNQKNGATVKSFEELEELTEMTIDNLRRVTRALRPIYLEDLGLLAALEMLTREVTQVTGIEVDFNISGPEKRLAPKVELALYRIVQEALSNVARHADASRASVNVSFTPEAVTLEVVDNGQGFEVPRSPAEFAPGGHYGLLGLFERAELIDADLRIESKIGQGTRVAVKLNL